MALNVKKALEAAYQIEQNIGELVELLRISGKGKVNVEHVGDIHFTPDQKNALEGKYNTLKTGIQNLASQLP